ncbi:hypothetical protein L596_022089 [Steinernema carpocapsae]|uniref:FHA domain-containing protein n=1 Tax=Steinernema carpocapsae TaxID=34508 RepID=A0A4U5MKP6_STECR|nr:hypothetical protein L596_022089 [Steinernema carpocapsae]
MNVGNGNLKQPPKPVEKIAAETGQNHHSDLGQPQLISSINVTRVQPDFYLESTMMKYPQLSKFDDIGISVLARYLHTEEVSSDEKSAIKISTTHSKLEYHLHERPTKADDLELKMAVLNGTLVHGRRDQSALIQANFSLISSKASFESFDALEFYHEKLHRQVEFVQDRDVLRFGAQKEMFASIQDCSTFNCSASSS